MSQLRSRINYYSVYKNSVAEEKRKQAKRYESKTVPTGTKKGATQINTKASPKKAAEVAQSSASAERHAPPLP